MSPSHKQTRRFLAAVGIIAPVVALAALSTAQERPQGRRPPGPQHLYNIKVLKGMSPQQVIDVMRKVSASLGVRCDFCHVVRPGDPRSWARDDKKEKRIARDMIVMTNDINAHYRVVGRQVTCFTCHHGRPMPENSPAMGEGRPAGERREGGEREGGERR